jgi:hypothetical protein
MVSHAITAIDDGAALHDTSWMMVQHFMAPSCIDGCDFI